MICSSHTYMYHAYLLFRDAEIRGLKMQTATREALPPLENQPPGGPGTLLCNPQIISQSCSQREQGPFTTPSSQTLESCSNFPHKFAFRTERSYPTRPQKLFCLVLLFRQRFNSQSQTIPLTGRSDALHQQTLKQVKAVCYYKQTCVCV